VVALLLLTRTSHRDLGGQSVNRLQDSAATSVGRSAVLRSLRDARPAFFALAARNAYDLAVGPSGVIYVADGRWPRVIAVSLDGSIRWQANRRGIGPGELTFPYRIALSDRGDPLVLDIGAKNLLWFDQDGRMLRRTNLGMTFATVSDVAVLQHDDVIVAGITDDPRGAGKALHVFTKELSWVRSMAALPKLAPEILQLWGVGSITRASLNTVYYAPKFRGGISEISVSGRVMRRIAVDDRDLTDPTGYFKVTGSAATGSRVATGDSLVAPGQVLPLAQGRVLTTKILGRRFRLTEYDAAGAVVGTLEIGQDDPMPFAFDSISCRLFVRGRHKEGLALGLIPIRPVPSARAITSNGESSYAKTAYAIGCRAAVGNSPT